MDKDISNITSFLGGGWVSIALSVIVVGLLIWWSFKKHAILVDAAKTESEKERTSTEQGEIKKGVGQDAADAAGQKTVDDFMGK